MDETCVCEGGYIDRKGHFYLKCSECELVIDIVYSHLVICPSCRKGILYWVEFRKGKELYGKEVERL